MRITLGPKNLWQCSTQPPFTTQTREIEGRKASLPMEQVSQSGHLAQQMLDEHANLYGQVLSQCQYFLVSKSIYFPWQNAHTATKNPDLYPPVLSPDPRLHKGACWQQLSYDHKRRSFADQRDPGGVRGEAEGMWCMERENQSVSILKKTWSLWMTMLSPALGKQRSCQGSLS